jgi:hypothetical protein
MDLRKRRMEEIMEIRSFIICTLVRVVNFTVIRHNTLVSDLYWWLVKQAICWSLCLGGTTGTYAHISIHTRKSVVNISSGILLFKKKFNDGTLTK